MKTKKDFETELVQVVKKRFNLQPSDYVQFLEIKGQLDKLIEVKIEVILGGNKY